MSREPTSLHRAPPVRHAPPHDAPEPRVAPRRHEPAPPPRPPARMAAVAYSALIARVFRTRRPGQEDDALAAGPLHAERAERGAGGAHGAVGAIDAAGHAGEAMAGTSEAAVAIDIAPLRDRISRCLALHAHLTHAWSVTTRLRRDVAPSSHLVLACDTQGRLSLCLTSALPAVVAAMHAERPALLAALAEWSTGQPEVEVRLGETAC